jgi:hypothetical protein
MAVDDSGEDVAQPESELPDDAGEIKDSDIVFDCSHCGKSLAIDYRGAGLTIPCSDCGNMVEVPIPEGMQLADLDTSEEQRESMILGLRRSLVAANRRIAQLEAEIDEINARRETLEKGRSDNIYQFGKILEKVSVVQALQEQMSAAITAVSDIAKEAR